MGLCQPILSIYAREEYNATFTAVALLSTAWSVVRCISNIPTTILAVKKRRRKIILLGVFLMAIGYLAMFVSTAYLQLCIGYTLTGLGSALAGTTVLSSVVEMAPKDKRAKYVSWIFVATRVETILAAPIGGWTYQEIGKRSPFLIGGIVGVIGVILLFILFKKVNFELIKETEKGSSPLKNNNLLKPYLRNHSILIVLISVIIVSFIRYGVYVPLFPLYANEILKISPTLIGALMSLSGIVGLFSTYIGGYLADRFGRKIILIPATILEGFGALMTIFTYDFIQLSSVTLLRDFGSNLRTAIPMAYMGDMAPSGLRTQLVGFLRTAEDMGGILGPIIFGYIAEIGGLISTFTLGGMITIIVAISLIFIKEDKKETITLK
jgi:MFS family permease